MTVGEAILAGREEKNQAPGRGNLISP